MPTHNRNDTPVTAKLPQWHPIIQQAAARKSVRGLPTPPPGIAPRTGAYYTTTRTVRTDGTVRVYVKWCEPRHRTTVLGAYIVDDNSARITPGKIIRLACGRSVRVAVDASGLPYPVPVLP